MASKVKDNEKKVAILTSGGDASGMNACVRACVRHALSLGYKVYGVRYGYVGLIGNDIYEMNYKSVSNTVHTGGTILHSGRSKDFKNPEVYKAAADNLLKIGCKNLIAIGGDGTYRGANCLHKDTELNVIGIPATIDNDMGYTDYTIGFDTACNTVLDAVLKLRDTITSHDRIMVLEVMGRACGQIALYSALAGGAEYIILPEAPVDIDEIAQSVKEGFDKGKTSTIIMLAEGRNDIKEELMKKVAEVTNRTVNDVALKYLQRGGTPSMFDRVLATKYAVRAVELLDCGQSGRAVGCQGTNIVDMSLPEAVAKKRVFEEQLYEITNKLSK